MEAGAATKGASTSADEETNRPSRGKEGGPSLNSLALIRKATAPLFISSVDFEDWHRMAYEGVLLEKNTQKFWVDKKLHKNCFLVYPMACDIAGRDEESCWCRITEEEKCIVGIPILKSKKLSLLLVQGRFKTRVLSPNTTYEVAFVVQLAQVISNSFEVQVEYNDVKLKLNLPDGKNQIHHEDLGKVPIDEWTELYAGEFMMCPDNVGTIYFALQGKLNLKKADLILKGVLIRPKDSAKHNRFVAGESSCS